MSFEPDFIPYPSSKGRDAVMEDLFFAPDPQLAFAPPPASFDSEFDNDEQVEERDFELSLKFKQVDDFYANFLDTIPVTPTPPAVTHSTESVSGVSQYSCDLTLSDYSIPSEIESRGSVNDGIYNTHAFVQPAAAFFNSLPLIPPPSPSEAVAVQESATGFLSAADLVVPDEAHEAQRPVKPFHCPVCPFCESEARNLIIGSFLLPASARKHNLKTHVRTHNKEESKCFGCKICGRQFTRKHDLRRHRATLHGEQTSSSSSVSGISKRSVDPTHDRPGLSHHCITLNGDPTPMLSANPDSFSNSDAAIDISENMIAWLLQV